MVWGDFVLDVFTLDPPRNTIPSINGPTLLSTLQGKY